MVLERAFTDLRQHKLNKWGDAEEIFSMSDLVLKLDLVIHKNKYNIVLSGISTEFSEDSLPP
jgi:hypothetical protein